MLEGRKKDNSEIRNLRSKIDELEETIEKKQERLQEYPKIEKAIDMMTKMKMQK